MPRDLRSARAAQARMARERVLATTEGDHARAAQDALLAQCVTANTDTQFGREHGFAAVGAGDLDAYRAAVPIRHYDDLAPWIERAAEGAPAVLTAADPVRFWKTTGTSSKAKKIPVTLASQMRVAESFLAFEGTQLGVVPELNERADTALYPHFSPRPITEWLAGRFPYCSTTEAPIEMRKGNEAFLAPWLAPLAEVPLDDAERLYFLLCFTALHDLVTIGCLHPSRFQTLVATLDAVWPRLVAEIHDGTILGRPMRAPRPERARELEAIARREGTLRPRDVWPNLKLLTSWSGSYIGRYLPLMQAGFCAPSAPLVHLATPSISSECFMTITIDGDRVGQPLNLRGGVFEFIPAGEKVEPGSRTLLFDELEVGASYEIVVTTLAGLYRYALCDIFRVIGFVGRVPRLEYIGRRAVSDLTGEKLAETQVAESARAVLAEAGAESASYTLCAIQATEPGTRPHYVLVLEAEAGWPLERAGEVGRRLDERFHAVNPRYAMKRGFHDLGPVAVEVVPPGTFARYRELRVARGAPAGQLKDQVLHAAGAAVLADLRACRP